MRDLLIIAGMCIAAIAVGAWLYLYGPTEFIEESTEVPATVIQEVSAEAEAEAPKATDVPFTVIGHGSKAASITERKNYAIYTKEEYARIWKLTGSAEKMPTIDFTKAYVVAVFAGTRTTGGYAISVDKVLDTGDARAVHVLIEKPGVGCITTQSLTSPYQIIRVPFSGASLSHTDTEKEVSCS